MENLGITGYLVEKTAQKRSLKSDNSNYEDYKKKNIIAYIHKKISNTRERLGSNLTPLQMASGVTFVVRNDNVFSDIQMEKVHFEKETEYLDKQLEKLKKTEEDQYTDDFYVETKGGEDLKKPKDKKQRVDVSKKLINVINQALEEKKLIQLFTEYQRVQLKDRIDSLNTGKKLNFAKLQEKIQDSKDGSHDDDHDQIDYVISQITNQSKKKPRGVTVGQILRIDDKTIKYKSKKLEDDEREQRRQGRLAMEALNELIREEEERQKKGIIKIFQETKLDNMDGDAAKHKYKMVNFKKKQEIQEKLFQEMANQEKNAYHDAVKEKDGEPARYLRSKTNQFTGPTNHVNVYQRLAGTETSPLKQTHRRNKTTTDKPTSKLQFISAADQLKETIKQLSPNLKISISDNMYQTISAGSTRPNSSRHIHQFQTSQSSDRFTHAKKKASKPDLVSQFSLNKDKEELLTTPGKRTHSSLPVSFIQQQSNNEQAEKQTHREIIKKPKELMEWSLQDLQEKLNSYMGKKNYKQDENKCKQILEKKQLQYQMEKFINTCKSHNKDISHQITKFRGRMGTMEEIIRQEIDKVDKIDFEKPPSNLIKEDNATKNEKFAKFKRERNFKRNLVAFLLDKVENKSDLISKYNTKKWTEDMLAQIELQRQDQKIE